MAPTAAKTFNKIRGAIYQRSSSPSSPSSSTPTPDSSLRTDVGGIAAGVSIGLLVLVALFAATIWYMKRRGTRTTQEPAQPEAKPLFLDHDAENRHSKRLSHLGSEYAPGVEPEEAYMLFGGSTVSSVDPAVVHERRVSDSFVGRLSVESCGDERYPSLGHRSSRQSMSLGAINLFGDTSPHEVPRSLSTASLGSASIVAPAERRLSSSGADQRPTSGHSLLSIHSVS